MIRVGFGYDIHPLVTGRPMIIGGVRIPYEKGLEGHSDADVMAHAVADALLGAAGLGDIGEHYPDTDADFAGFDSMIFLREIEKKIHFEKYEIVNVDISLVLQRPKISPHKKRMEQNIAANLFITPDRVNVKATTGEGLGYIGRGEGVICYATAVLQPVKP